MKSIYESGKYLQNNPSWHLEDAERKYNQIRKIIIKNDVKFDTVIDIGCGIGAVLNYFAVDFSQKNLFGIDLSHEIISIAKKKYPNIHFESKSITDIKTNHDIALILDVVEHIEDFYDFLRNCKKISSYQIFRIPLELNSYSIFTNNFIKNRKKYGHIHHFNTDIIINILEEQGFQILDYHFDETNFKDSSIKAKLIFPFKYLVKIINRKLAENIFGGSFLVILTKK